jgi:hypothetical protein
MPLLAAAILAGGLLGVPGAFELLFYAGPVLLLVGLLLNGCFPGEALILARRVARAPRRRPARRRWARSRERALMSQLERSSRLLRGPPAPAAA